MNKKSKAGKAATLAGKVAFHLVFGKVKLGGLLLDLAATEIKKRKKK